MPDDQCYISCSDGAVFNVCPWLIIVVDAILRHIPESIFSTLEGFGR